MAKNQNKKAFSLNDEIAKTIDQLYEDLKEKEVIGTYNDLFIELLETYNTKKDNSKKFEDKIKELQEQLYSKDNELKQVQEELEETKNKPVEVEQDKELLEEIEHLKETLKNETECKQKAYEELQKSSVEITNLKANQKYNNDNVVMVDFGKFKPLISTTVERLNNKYSRTDITANQLLFTMFMRYTTERLTNIFYPFVLTDKEIEDITGTPVKEIKEFFKK